MVRKYTKENLLYPYSKISKDEFVRVVFGYCSSMTATRCANNLSCSRTTVQTIYSGLNRRVGNIMDGNYPNPETKAAADLMSVPLREALFIMQRRHKIVERYFADDISYDEYKHYRDTGELTEKNESSEMRFHRYNMYRTLHDYSRLTFGITRESFHNAFNFCKFQYMVGIAIIELSDEGSIKVENDKTERCMMCLKILMLSLAERPLSANG